MIDLIIGFEVGRSKVVLIFQEREKRIIIENINQRFDLIRGFF